MLIVNRGEIARRVIRTCKKLGVKTVAVFTQPDALAPHVREADKAIFLGDKPHEYTNAAKLMQVRGHVRDVAYGSRARRQGTQAVLPRPPHRPRRPRAGT